MGMVLVLPGKLPATMMVAPNSPMARANAKVAPAMMPRAERGMTTRVAVWSSERPSM